MRAASRKTSKALGDIARARGKSQVAHDAGVSRESLYKALSGERTPGFDTIIKVMSALGLKLHAETAPIPNHAQQDASTAECSPTHPSAGLAATLIAGETEEHQP